MLVLDMFRRAVIYTFLMKIPTSLTKTDRQAVPFQMVLYGGWNGGSYKKFQVFNFFNPFFLGF